MCLIAEQAEAYRIGYKMGFVQIHEIKKWADGIIEKYDSFHPCIIDISLLNDHAKSFVVIDTLSGISGRKDNNKVFHLVLTLFANRYFKGGISPEAASNALYALATSGWLEEDSSLYFDILRLTDMIDLAISSIDATTTELESFLKPYAESTAFL